MGHPVATRIPSVGGASFVLHSGISRHAHAKHDHHWYDILYRSFSMQDRRGIDHIPRFEPWNPIPDWVAATEGQCYVGFIDNSQLTVRIGTVRIAIM
jgi:hypothetical protein